jgi:cytochrome o ubiquinol oxidase subunit 2
MRRPERQRKTSVSAESLFTKSLFTKSLFAKPLFTGTASRARRALRGIGLVAMCGVLAGCNMTVLLPAGDVAVQQRNLVIASTVLMLFIIVPVIVLIFLFAWHYRQSNQEATYDPEWHHSTQLEVAIWAAPLVIIIALGAMTWTSTHVLDPFRPLARLSPSRPVPVDDEPLIIEAVALDWKWLFFYPGQGIATVNELAAPVNRPLSFKITASTVMNAFYVPALAGMIYAMPGMQTQLHAVINKEGRYEGLSANYSGSGFSGMTFKFYGLTRQGFDDWVSHARAQGTPLTGDLYLQLEKPSEREPVHYYSSVEDGLYHRVLNMCVVAGKMCLSEMMHIDARGGAGTDSRENREKLEYDNRHVQRSDMSSPATVPPPGAHDTDMGASPHHNH